MGRICFPVSNDEIIYDPANQQKIKIYDSNSGDYFYKVVDNDKNMTDADYSVYVLVNIINGEDDPQESSAR